MVMQNDSTLKLPIFYRTSKDDIKQHWFTCEEIQAVKQTSNDVAKVTH